jgi:hypothetical protein
MNENKYVQIAMSVCMFNVLMCYTAICCAHFVGTIQDQTTGLANISLPSSLKCTTDSLLLENSINLRKHTLQTCLAVMSPR